MLAAHADDSEQQTSLAELAVGVPQERNYTYPAYGKTLEGVSFFVCFVVSLTTTKYCKGNFTRRGKEPSATTLFTKAKEKFNDGTAWQLTKAACAAREKSFHIGSPVHRSQRVDFHSGASEHSICGVPADSR